jgi:hypothetical protein
MRVSHTAGGRREDYHRRAAVIEVIRRGGSQDDALVPARVLVVYDCDLAGGKRNGERGVIADGGHGFDGRVWKLLSPTYIGQCEQKNEWDWTLKSSRTVHNPDTAVALARP